jgi:MerR family transcriptional regulator/heat shock protein HspR
MIHEQGLNQEGLRRLLALLPCWEIKGCAPDAQNGCTAWIDRTTPCWELARRTCAQAKHCSECEVYLSARDHLRGKADFQAEPGVSLVD